LHEAGAGQGPGVITVQRTVETPAPRAAVESYLTDFTSTVEWDPNTKDCRAVDHGPVRVGKRYDNVQKLGPGSTTLRYEVVAYSPPPGHGADRRRRRGRPARAAGPVRDRRLSLLEAARRPGCLAGYRPWAG